MTGDAFKVAHRDHPKVHTRRNRRATQRGGIIRLAHRFEPRVEVGLDQELAEARSLPRAQIALAWLLHKPVVISPIVGGTKSHHLEDAVGALSVKLSDEEIKSLGKPYIPHPLAGFE